MANPYASSSEHLEKTYFNASTLRDCSYDNPMCACRCINTGDPAGVGADYYDCER
ncbi:MAG: hypothetical protein ACI4RJ_03260 [Alphaproteobacteria bacterium]